MQFMVAGTAQWLISAAGVLQAQGAQSITTTAGALTLAPIETLELSPAANKNVNVTVSGTGDFAVNTNQLYVDSSLGNVGIGTTAPLSALQVKAAANKEIQIGSTAGIYSTATYFTDLVTLGSVINIAQPNNGAFNHSIFSYDTTAAAKNQLGIASRSDTVFLNAGAETMRILDTGNVGIGTTSPGSLTEIQGGLTTTGAILTLGSKETTTVANDVLGRINFYAPLDAAGTDANLVAASIVARAEGTFSASSNATSLLFQTGASEVATTKMTLSSAGVVTLAGAAYATTAGIILNSSSGVLSSSTDLPSGTTLGTFAVARIKKQAIGDGDATDFTITHGWNLTDRSGCNVQVVYNADPWDTAEMVYVTRPTANTVKIDFQYGGIVPTTDQFMVIITG